MALSLVSVGHQEYRRLDQPNDTAQTDFPEQQGWDKLMALNVKAPYYCTVAFLPLLEAAAVRAVDPGRVIMISSMGGVAPEAESPIAGKV